MPTTATTIKSKIADEYVLVTGGAGYIGSHTVLELLQLHQRVVIVDNLCNSSIGISPLLLVQPKCPYVHQIQWIESLERVEAITGRSVHFHKVDLLDRPALTAVFRRYPNISAVIHFAGLKAVGESVAKPLLYYHNNITGTLVLLEVMREMGVKRLVFSSSATVYGQPERLPLTEDCRLSATNPYGRTKLYIEEILRDWVVAEPSWSVVLLRYFNPVGAHPRYSYILSSSIPPQYDWSSGRIGEDPQGVPNNLMPYVSQVAVGRRAHVCVFGNDYPTKDGTGVRDYIHVVDLALGHVAALKKVMEMRGAVAYNLGTGTGYSVLEMIAAMSEASGRTIPYQVTDRRPGDVANVYADVSKAAEELQWRAKLGLREMCQDLWRWQEQNPDGYKLAAVDVPVFPNTKSNPANVNSKQPLEALDSAVDLSADA